MRWKVFGLAVFAFIIAFFTLSNNRVVTISVGVANYQVNLVLVILGSVLLGMFLMAILWSIRAWETRRVIHAQRRRLDELEESVAQYQERSDTEDDGEDDGGGGWSGDTDEPEVADGDVHESGSKADVPKSDT